MHDIVFLFVPYADVSLPPLGISVLSGVVKSHGYKSYCIDLAMKLQQECIAANKNFENTQLSLLSPESTIIDPFVEEFFDRWIQTVLDLKPRYIGISIFSFFSHFTTFYLCNKIRQKNPSVKIVLGGPGVGIGFFNEIHELCNISTLESMQKFGEVIRQRNLVDHVIVGDGEQAIIDLLSTDLISNEDKFQISDYKQEFPFADFDDFELHKYQGTLGKGYPQLPMFTSKGCVRSCDFCDVYAVQQKFRFRHGKNIVKEMIYLAERYDIRDFNFTDSLVNGSLSALQEWVSELAIYNKQNPDKRITWSGHWICRPAGQTKPEFYQLLAESGCAALSIGAESGSNKVLTAMNKKTTVEALYYEAEQFYKYNIKFMTLMIVAHWSEEWDDFIASVDMLYNLSHFVRTGNYIAVNLGSTLAILKNTPMDLNTEQNKIQYQNNSIWWTPLNPSLTAKERYYRLLIMEKFCDSLNLPLAERVLPFIHKRLLDNSVTIKEYYKDKVKDINKLPEQHAEYFYRNFDQFLLQIKNKHHESTVDILIDIQAHVVNNFPVVEIYFNNELVKQQALAEGLHCLEILNIPAQNLNKVAVRLTNKLPEDTLVDSNGIIVKDKFLELKKFSINGINLLDDVAFYMSTMQYYEQGQSVEPKFGFWLNNSELSLEFANPFKHWYNQHSKKNAKLAATIVSPNFIPTQLEDEYFRNEIVEILQTIDY